MTGHLGGTRDHPRQRRVVAVATALFATAALIAPGVGPTTAEANGANFPFSCGTGGTDDSYRNTFGLSTNATSTSTSGTITPCLSGTQFQLSLPQPASGDAASVTGVVKMDSGSNVKMADGKTANLYHIAFANFSIHTTANSPVLRTVSGTAAAGSQAPYTLSMTPDPAGGTSSPPVIGGDGVLTDMWVTGSSTFVIDLSAFSILAAIACPLAGGSGSTSCTVTASGMSSTMVKLMNQIGISTLSIKSMNLNFYYLVTHTSNGGVPSGTALQFPRTTLTVSPS